MESPYRSPVAPKKKTTAVLLVVVIILAAAAASCYYAFKPSEKPTVVEGNKAADSDEKVAALKADLDKRLAALKADLDEKVAALQASETKNAALQEDLERTNAALQAALKIDASQALLGKREADSPPTFQQTKANSPQTFPQKKAKPVPQQEGETIEQTLRKAREKLNEVTSLQKNIPSIFFDQVKLSNLKHKAEKYEEDLRKWIRLLELEKTSKPENPQYLQIYQKTLQSVIERKDLDEMKKILNENNERLQSMGSQLSR